MKKNLVIISLILASMTFALTGCGSSSDSQSGTQVSQTEDNTNNSDNTDKTPENAPPMDNKANVKKLMGKVVAINGNQITLKQTSDLIPAGDKPNGEKPNEPATGDVPPAPNGDNNDKPNGQPPQGGNAISDNVELSETDFNGEEITITIDDESVLSLAPSNIQDEKSQATLSDIKEGSILNIEYDEDGTTIDEVIITNE